MHEPCVVSNSDLREETGGLGACCAVREGLLVAHLLLRPERARALHPDRRDGEDEGAQGCVYGWRRHNLHRRTKVNVVNCNYIKSFEFCFVS